MRTIAFGASASPEKVGYQLVDALRHFAGEVFPLNPKATEVAGRRAYASLRDLPSVLVELGYMSNETDRMRLESELWRARAADALARGIALWATRASPGFVSPKR